MSKMKKRNRRVSRMDLSSCLLDGNTLVLSEYRDGCERVFKVDLGDSPYISESIHDACLKHVIQVREVRAAAWRRANESVKRMGGS